MCLGQASNGQNTVLSEPFSRPQRKDSVTTDAGLTSDTEQLTSIAALSPLDFQMLFGSSNEKDYDNVSNTSGSSGSTCDASLLEQTWLDLQPDVEFLTSNVMVTTAEVADDRINNKTKKRTLSSSASTTPSNDKSAGNLEQQQFSKNGFNLDLPVTIEQEKVVACKRARNTEAARRSRARKVERLVSLQSQVEQLQQRNSELERDNALLQGENKSCDRRIHELEKQISDLHGILSAYVTNASVTKASSS